MSAVPDQFRDQQLRTQLQGALGDAFTLERELGGGGMSRVFVALDARLGRRVVVKVLHPELAAEVSTARFQREVALAARLQHPHVVPLLTAGETDGLPFYTMPFVQGETLRDRLRRDGTLAVGDAVRLLRELADALAYAHGEGVVHRDLKPENVLLSGGHAVVADFGVAKAISAATQGTRRDEHGGAPGNATALGVAVGTPAYMAPEQAAADPQTDHRADLYALGVVAYELLAGRPPFHGLSPQQLLAAHAVTVPEPVTAHRAEVAPDLAALVMRLLEKRPADRPGSANEVVQALDAVLAETSGRGTTASRAGTGDAPWSRRRRLMALGVGLLVVAGIGTGLALSRRAPPDALDPNLIAIAPFRVAGDPSLAYLREGMLDLLAAKLTGEGGPRAGDPRTLLAAWQKRAGSADADLAESEAIALARELGAGQVLLGAVVGTPQRISLRATLQRVPSGDGRVSADVEGVPDSLGVLVDRLAASLLARSTGESERLAGTIATAPLPVLRLYLAGVADVRRGRYPEAQQSFQRALALDSTFVHAAFALVTNNGNHPIDDSRAWALLERAEHRLNELDRAEVEARRRFVRGDSYASQLEANRRVVALAPDRAEGWAGLGQDLLLFGRLTGASDFRERARAALVRALQLDPEFTSPLRAMLEVSAELGDTAAVREHWSRYQRLAPGALEFETVRWVAAQALGDSATLSAMRARFGQLPPRDLLRIVERMMVSGRGLADARAVLGALEASAVDDYDVDRGGLAFSSYLLNGGRDEEVPARFRRGGVPDPADEDLRAVAGALFWDADPASAPVAVARLEAVARGDGPASLRRWAACFPALWHLLRGDTVAAQRPLALVRPLRVVPAEPGDAQYEACALSAEALLERARGTTAGRALGRLDSLLAQGYEGMQFGNLIAARLHEDRGDRRAALTAVRRRSNHGRDGPVMLTTMLREEGRLAALTGDTAGAIRAYRHFLALRPDPAPRLRADRDRVRAALAGLEGARR